MNENHPWKSLLVWQKAHCLIIDIYSLTKKFPSDEKFGITQQIRRAAVSIANNIVEGKSKSSNKEFVHFLYISRGSLEETRYLVLLSHDLGFIDQETNNRIESVCSEISFLLNKLIKSIKK